jgi:hypothetical protein
LALNAAPFAADPFATFTFHYYYPYAFTHQSIGARRFLNAIPYPAHPDSLAGDLQSLTERINNSSLPQEQRSSMLRESERALRTYFALGFDRAAIKKSFDQVSEWATRSSIPGARILLGEFGVVRSNGGYQGARDEDRARWLRDVREEAENRGYGWAIWVYRGEGGMAIFDESRSQSGFDKPTLAALGLLPAPRAAAPNQRSCQAAAC